MRNILFVMIIICSIITIVFGFMSIHNSINIINDCNTIRNEINKQQEAWDRWQLEEKLISDWLDEVAVYDENISGRMEAYK